MKPKHMTISDLSRATSIPPSTIRSYLSKALLPVPIRTGKTVAYYTKDHLERLKYIKKLRQGKKRSLSEIKEMVENKFPHTIETVSPEDIYNQRRQMIIDAALKVFKKKGYNGATVEAIVSKAGVGKNTFYQYYQNKESLFIECADSLCREIVNEMDKQVVGETDLKIGFIKRAMAFLTYYPKWINIINVLRGASVSNNQLFVDKLNDVMKTMTENLIKEVNEIKANDPNSLFRNIDSTIVGYSLMGMAEYCAYLYYNNQKLHTKVDVNAILDQAWSMYIQLG